MSLEEDFAQSIERMNKKITDAEAWLTANNINVPYAEGTPLGELWFDIEKGRLLLGDGNLKGAKLFVRQEIVTRYLDDYLKGVVAEMRKFIAAMKEGIDAEELY